LLRHQWCQGCCGVQVAVFCGGTGSMVSVEVSVVVGGVDDGVGDGLVVCEDVVVDECVVAGVGALPPPPLARMARPAMMIAIRISTARPHRVRTHRLRYQGDGLSVVLKRSVSSMFALPLE
jgi:hypothetical protein